MFCDAAVNLWALLTAPIKLPAVTEYLQYPVVSLHCIQDITDAALLFVILNSCLSICRTKDNCQEITQ